MKHADFAAKRMAVVSTAHLSKAAKKFLSCGGTPGDLRGLTMIEEHADENPERLFVNFIGDRFWLDGGGDSIVSFPIDRGWLVYAHEDFTGDDADQIPAELASIIGTCNDHHFTWIMFDDEAETTEGLRTFEDEPEAVEPPPTMEMLVLSTAHLDAASVSVLNCPPPVSPPSVDAENVQNLGRGKMRDTRPGIDGRRHSWMETGGGVLDVVPMRYGWLLRVPSAEDMPEATPPIWAICSAARDLNCSWVRLDADGPIVSWLPVLTKEED